MAFRLYAGFDDLRRSDLCGLDGLDIADRRLFAVSRNDLLRDGIFNSIFRGHALDQVHIDGGLIDPCQSFINIFEFGFVRDCDGVVADEVQNDLRHSAGFAVARARKDDILHLAAAKRFCALLTQDPRDGVRDVRLSATVRPDNGSYAAAGEDYLRVVGK